jgi:TetR/AcrR family transcriptional regulator, transcriptional repressor for nem operon
VSALEDRPADSTRLHILEAAARQFATSPYSQVNLDDILATAKVTKGALYFHFRSKQALATAVVEHRSEQSRLEFEGVMARGLSGIEAMVDVTYMIAMADIGDELGRAGLNLLESVGRFDGLQTKVVDSWITGYAELARRAIAEGDIVDGSDPEQVARLVVSTYLGLRQTSNLDHPKTFIGDLESALLLVLPGFANHDRLGYLAGSIRRRSALAVRNAVPIRANNL